MTSTLSLESVCKSYGMLRALKPTSLSMEAGEFLTLLGPSGSGKSTLLSILAGLITPDEGRITIGETDVTDLPANARDIGMIFQNYALFPHLTIRENIAFPLRMRKRRADVVKTEVDRILEIVHLTGMGDRLPSELSGGQQQRVAFARCAVYRPSIILMDEPFGALDPVTRDALGERVRSLHRELNLTTVMVTHDMAEALLLADRVLVMSEGRIVADETPAGLLSGAGGEKAQALVAVPRAQAERLARIDR